MSKLARAVQVATIHTNWNKMAKMLFWADPNQGRREQFGKLLSEQSTSPMSEKMPASYNTEQLQYILGLMLILTIAEKRSQEMYQQNFAQRCDAISAAYDLKDDQYWTDGKTPAEWNLLAAEFEQRSVEILIDTLKEYQFNDIAELVQTDGPEQLFEIIENIEAQFQNALKDSFPETSGASTDGGSIPETLQSKRP